jgi:hypothetical protein
VKHLVILREVWPILGQTQPKDLWLLFKKHFVFTTLDGHLYRSRRR